MHQAWDGGLGQIYIDKEKEKGSEGAGRALFPIPTVGIVEKRSEGRPDRSGGEPDDAEKR
jgi:hypothetical protein